MRVINLQLTGSCEVGLRAAGLDNEVSLEERSREDQRPTLLIRGGKSLEAMMKSSSSSSLRPFDWLLSLQPTGQCCVLSASEAAQISVSSVR